MSAPRKNIMLGTAGHVDHGKSALVKLLTGCDTDTLAEEKQRGLTIDLGFAPCRLADQRIVGVVDVPGHADFIRNMVAGAHGISVVILVVAADDGVMPQTREHLAILRLMGLRHGVIAVTKIDLVEPELRELVREDVRRLVAGTFLETAPVCLLSSVTGEGFEGFFDSLNQVANACAPHSVSGPARVWVADVFALRGAGVVVTGIPTHGVVRPGDSLVLWPGGRSGRVRRLEVYGEEATEGLAGECVALNLADLDHQLIDRGMVLATADVPPPVGMAEVELRRLEGVGGELKDYAEVQFHVGTAAVAARLALLERAPMQPGERQMVQVRLASPLPMVTGERFVVRGAAGGPHAQGVVTLGGGTVLGVSNVRLRRQRPWTLAMLAARRDALGSAKTWCGLLLRETGCLLEPRELARRALLRPEELTAVLEDLRAGGVLVETRGGRVAHREVLAQASEKVLAAVGAGHRSHPKRLGSSAAELLPTVSGQGELLELTLASLLAAGRLLRAGEVYFLPEWQPCLSPAEERLAQRLVAELETAGWASPTVAELAADLTEPPAAVEALLRLAAERGILVRLTADLFLHRTALEGAQQVALQLFARRPSFSTMEFRDALGVSRKHVVPLLDYLDQLRFTVRAGHDRTPGVEAKKRLPGARLVSPAEQRAEGADRR